MPATSSTTAPERHATWFELFFDLVFVVAISALSHTLLAHNMSWKACGFFAFLFIPVWWIWMGFSYYIDQFELTTFRQYIVLFCAMFAIISLAITIPSVFHYKTLAFIVLYIILRIFLLILYAAAWYKHKSNRALIMRYIIGFSIGIFIWAASIPYPAPTCFAIWGIALTIEIITPIIAYLTIKQIPAQISHMDERFGLFTIIVLGDTIVSVALGLQEMHWAKYGLLNAIGGFICAIAMWSLYFNAADTDVIHKALRGGKSAIRWSFVYGYSHFLVFSSIAAFGVAIYGIIIPHITTTVLTKILLFSSIITYLGGTLSVKAATQQSFITMSALTRIAAIIAVLLAALITWAHFRSLSIPVIALLLGFFAFFRKI